MKECLLLIIFKLTYTLHVDEKPKVGQNHNSQLGVRAVVIQCEVPEDGLPSDSDSIRFQREELFKHNALQDCKQKLAITIKMSSDPNQASGDEYIPIEHVLGVNNKRIRLLNPYVLRLRRKTSYQAYKLRKIDTVSGAIADILDNTIGGINNGSRRVQRDLPSTNLRDEEDWSANFGFGSSIKLDHEGSGRHSYSIKLRELKHPLHTTTKTEGSSRIDYFDQNNLCANTNGSFSLSLRNKRHDITDKDYEYKFPQWTPTELALQKLHKHQRHDNTYYKQPYIKINEQESDKLELYEDRDLLDAVDKKNNDIEIDNRIVKKLPNPNIELRNSKSYNSKDILNADKPDIAKTKSSETKSKLYKKNLEYNHPESKNGKNGERDFIIYEIGDPSLWYSAQVQLYEKLSTPEGKTVWNDLTKDETASVTSTNPEWSNEDINIQYKPTEFLSRDDFTLPVTDLCLVVSTKRDHENDPKDNIGEFMIVPVDDIIALDEPKEINKRNNNYSDSNTVPKGDNKKSHRQVIVRTTRALMGGSAEHLKIVSRGTDKYLKLPHTKPHYTQMDLEAKADDNELIIVGAFGRLTTIVSDSTRRIRSILTVQATNTGLAAARMRVLVRECSPGLLDSSTDSDLTIAGPVILPPKHTKTFLLKIPLQIPIENGNCIIALVNDNDESVAVRDVRIKRDDRCYCVWHCDCVCLGEDPKLLCRDMTAAQLSAAGLSMQQNKRYARSVCYPDVVPLNLLVIFVGVLTVLLFLGFIKALLGLACRCVASWGLYRFLDTPRKLDHYYERSLRNRRVIYDDEGWPVHPDTGERSVGLVSEPMEFILNVIFFITLPCLIIWDAMRKVSRCQAEEDNSDNNYKVKEDYNKCFSSRDVQITERRKRRRRRGLQRWMTPHAEELTSDIWHESLTPLGKKAPVCMQPLLQNESGFRRTCEQSFMDSEQDDTEYVLMQMQKSSESLANSQRRLELKTSVLHQGSNNISSVAR